MLLCTVMIEEKPFVAMFTFKFLNFVHCNDHYHYIGLVKYLGLGQQMVIVVYMRAIVMKSSNLIMLST